MKTFFSFLVGIALGAGGWYIYQTYYVGASGDSSSYPNDGQPSHGDVRDKVVALARIEPTGGVLEVGGLPGAQLAQLLVKEGDVVEAGAVLGILDTLPLKQMEIDSLDAQIAEAEARMTAELAVAEQRIETAKLAVERAQTAGEQDRVAQEAELQLLRATQVLAESDADRMSTIPSDIISPMEKAHQANLAMKARSSVAVAETQLTKLDRATKFGQRAAQADLAAAMAAINTIKTSIPITSLKQQRALAQKQLERATIRAPQAGTILKVFVQQGETLASQPILQLADLSQMEVVAEVYKDDVKRLSADNPATIKSSAFRAPFDKEGLQGKLVSIGRRVAGSGLQAMDPFARADRHVVEVRVELDAASSREASRFVDLQVDALFPTSTETAPRVSSAP